MSDSHAKQVANDGSFEFVAALGNSLECAGCGHQLRGRAIWRDAPTQLLFVQCPNCQRPEPIGYQHPGWSQRFAKASDLFDAALTLLVGGAIGPVVVFYAYKLVHFAINSQMRWMRHSGGQRAAFKDVGDMQWFGLLATGIIAAGLAMLGVLLLFWAMKIVSARICAAIIGTLIVATAAYVWIDVRVALYDYPDFHGTIAVSALVIIVPAVVVCVTMARLLGPMRMADVAARGFRRQRPDELAKHAEADEALAALEGESLLTKGNKQCLDCGYQLRGLQIVMEPRTSIAVVRCPECGNLMPVRGDVPVGEKPVSPAGLQVTGVLVILAAGLFFGFCCCGGIV